jgi:hypothetical protein
LKKQPGKLHRYQAVSLSFNACARQINFLTIDFVKLRILWANPHSQTVNIVISLAFFLPAIVCLVYFILRKNKTVIYLLPLLYLLIILFCKLDPKVFASEEGNFLFYILLSILFLAVFDYYYKRKGWNMISGFALIAHLLFSLVLVFFGCIVYQHFTAHPFT